MPAEFVTSIHMYVRIFCGLIVIDDALPCRYDRFSLRLLELTKNSGDNGSRLLLEGVSIMCWPFT